MLASIFAIALPLLAAVSATPYPGQCNRDLCFRGVFGTGLTQINPAQATLDCQANLGCTETPAATVTTTTTTVTAGVTYITVPAETQSATYTDGSQTCGTYVPAYASFCSGLPRYSSACSCNGATATTTTVDQPTKTATVVVTEPAVVFVTAGHDYYAL
jgi:hypothetical protein